MEGPSEHDQPREHRTSYQYKRLESSSSIRLLVLEPGTFEDSISCHLKHVSLESKPKYEALSYVWGDSFQTKEILCEGCSMKVTISLHQALRHLRSETVDRVIWADAICINQQDNDEKSFQVALMGEIYSHSHQVLVWIGEDIDSLSGTFQTVKELHEIFLQTEDGYPYDELSFENTFLPGSSTFSNLLRTQDMWKVSFLRLIRQPWFLRRWCLQEIAKAPSAIVVCGFQTVQWSMLSDVYWCIYQSGALSYILDPAEAATGFHTGIVIMGLIRRDSQKNDHAPLLESVVSTRYFKCTDPRDVVYSLLGLGGDVKLYGDSLTPDYSLSVEEVFKKFVIGCLSQKGCMYPLSVPYTPAQSGAMDLPSWVPDFTRLEATNPLIRMRMGDALPFHASRDSVPRLRISEDGNLLFSWGKVVDIIKQTAPPLDEVQCTGMEGLSLADIGIQRVKKWLALRKEIIAYHTVDEGKHNNLFESFWRTMIFNMTASADKPPSEYSSYFKVYLDHFFQSDVIVPETREPLRTQLLQIETAVNSRADGWRMFTTEHSRLGQGMRSVRAGDVVCVLDGGELPYVIRPVDDGLYRFIGSSYVHGLMDGEAYKKDDLESTEFCFC
ncbi:heterokaryon incompatibility protein-domain-containing protein [Rhexocercosporidium sp. MPI-PUGE-AT-0058]|nr:heterokaryon incompatibility protein-domain-containing protein [Rhexocercosporidium sp. MPI-PUGE-AT-0058]